MSKVVGIDIDGGQVRAALLRSAYRKIEVLGLWEENIVDHDGVDAALARCVAELETGAVDSVMTTADGLRTFIHQLSFPKTAEKRLGELLPFELEGELPVEVDEIVFDWVRLPTFESGEIPVMAIAAKEDHVASRIQLVKDALGREPERVGCPGTELQQLVQVHSELSGEGCCAVLNFGWEQVDICFLVAGKLRWARSLGVGVGDFPEAGTRAVALLKQTLAAFAVAQGVQVQKIWLCGRAAAMEGISEYLMAQLGVDVELLSEAWSLTKAAEAQKEKALTSDFGKFAKPIASALGGLRGRGVDLRTGPLAFQRGYSHVKARLPLLGGLATAILVSFLFSVWAEGRALGEENKALTQSLGELTKATFGQSIENIDDAEVALDAARRKKSEDPMPYIDGFGVAVALSETIPHELVHDIEELEVAKGKVKLRGIVSKAEDAQTVAQRFGEHRCVEDVKVTKITQVVNSDKERYQLEALLNCPEDGKKKKSGGSR
ncbi:MAG: hypothetical protein MK135_12395 [Polyangiaceae bacterium]|nr:hypothetical protein [Polyangiaceae bacterium]